MKCPGCHRTMISTIYDGLGCPTLGTPRCVTSTNHLVGNRITYHRPPHEAYKTFAAWGGSMFGHPEVPADAAACVSYCRDPSFDEYVHVEYFPTRAAAEERRRELVRDGYCTSVRDRHQPIPRRD